MQKCLQQINTKTINNTKINISNLYSTFPCENSVQILGTFWKDIKTTNRIQTTSFLVPTFEQMKTNTKCTTMKSLHCHRDWWNQELRQLHMPETSVDRKITIFTQSAAQLLFFFFFSFFSFFLRCFIDCAQLMLSLLL